jgi:hypothetical protein
LYIGFAEGVRIARAAMAFFLSVNTAFCYFFSPLASAKRKSYMCVFSNEFGKASLSPSMKYNEFQWHRPATAERRMRGAWSIRADL